MEIPKIDDAFVARRPLSYSSLKAFRKSPKHYLEYLVKAFVPSDAMLLGSITEKLLLYSEQEFNSEYLVYELGASKASKEGKQQYNSLIEQASLTNVTLVPKELYLTAIKMVESLLNYEELKPYLANIRRRRTALKWIDPSSKLPCIGYTDWESKIDRDVIICDLKTTQDADPETFNKTAFNFDYHVQVGSYLEGYKHTRFSFPSFLFVVVESKEPYNVSLMYVDNKMEKYCRDEFLGSLKAFRYCMDNDLFYQGYEFRLMKLMNYFSLTKPGYAKTRYGEFNDE